jgi:para-nitrobenzyl esterase
MAYATAFRGSAAACLIALTVLSGRAAADAGGTRFPQDLVGTEWTAAELAGMAVPPLAGNRQPHLVFEAGGRLAGSDGCNRISGSYTLTGEAVTFSQVVATQMACPDTAEVERRVHAVLKGTSHWKIVGTRLQFFGATGKPLAVFERRAPSAPTTPAPALQDTSWQLLRFQGSDGQTIKPDDPAKYTVDFATGGRVNARVDCNRGTGSWKATSASQLELGPLALTRAKCADDSMHDQIVKQWAFIRSFVIRDGHLFLALMADGGIYEFEPRAVKR